MALPTYGQALSEIQGLANGSPYTNVLKLVAPYLDGATLAATSRVSREWNRVLNRALWSDPLNIIKEKPKPFSRTVDWLDSTILTREVTRELVTTLNLCHILNIRSQTPSHQIDWNLNDHLLTGHEIFAFLDAFPNLRFMILNGVLGFASQGLDQGHVERIRGHEKFKLLMFSVHGCHDFDGTLSLGTQGRVHTPMKHLWYLDLSYTNRDEGWVTRLESLLKGTGPAEGPGIPGLKVLKLKGLRLTDKMAYAICRSVARTLWSLDLSNNLLTDQSIPIIAFAILTPRTQRRVPPGPHICDPLNPASLYEEPPQYVAEEHSTIAECSSILRPDSKDAFAEYVDIHGHKDRSGEIHLQDLDPLSTVTGITHLYLQQNKVTSTGIQTLLSGPNCLQVLDVGSVRIGPSDLASFGTLPLSRTLFQGMATTKLLSRGAGSRLEKLRIHHSIVTLTPTVLPISLNENSYDPDWVARASAAGKHLLRNIPADPGYQYDFDYAARTYTAATDHPSQEPPHPLPFTPLHNNRLKLLTLTGIPRKAPQFVVDNLIIFLKNCLLQEKLINVQRILDAPSHRNGPVLLSGLRELRLEFLVEQEPAGESSVSGDQDAMVALSASVDDFSFFPGEPRKMKGRVSDDGGQESGSGKEKEKEKEKEEELFDVPEKLREFRQACKEERWSGKIVLC